MSDLTPSSENGGHPIDPTASRRTLVLLSIGCGVGLLAATGALVAPSQGGLTVSPDAVAIVNGDVIRRDDYQRLLAGFEKDSSAPIDDKARRHVLDRMIDEELLVQRALALGLAQVDRRIRGNLTSALITSIVSTAEDREPEPGELESFYEEHREFFTRPGRVRVRQVFLRVPTGADEAAVYSRAESARDALLAGRSLDEIRLEYGDDEISPLPDTPLPALKLREYVGPTALRAALGLEIGGISDPVRSGVGLHVLVMADRTESMTPPLSEIEDLVRREWRRRAGDRALRGYLDQLREDGDVVVRIDFDD